MDSGPPLLDSTRSPFLVIWEVTQACDLACVHCRAEARPERDPGELTTAEGVRLIGEIASFGAPLLVLTGGDPLKRPDLFDLIARAAAAGLRVTVAPSGTPLLTREALREAKGAGIARLALSLDGPTAVEHDAFRRVQGSFSLSLGALRAALEEAIPIQVNSTVSRRTLEGLPALARLVGDLGVVLWSVFFLVPTGRGHPDDEITAEEHEELFHFLYDLSREVPFDIKTTAAPHYRRVAAQRRAREGNGRHPGGPGPNGIGRAGGSSPRVSSRSRWGACGSPPLPRSTGTRPSSAVSATPISSRGNAGSANTVPCAVARGRWLTPERATTSRRTPPASTSRGG